MSSEYPLVCFFKHALVMLRNMCNCLFSHQIPAVSNRPCNLSHPQPSVMMSQTSVLVVTPFHTTLQNWKYNLPLPLGAIKLSIDWHAPFFKQVLCFNVTDSSGSTSGQPNPKSKVC